MRLISWNMAGRVRCLDAQVEAISYQQPDAVALQEVTAKTAPLLQERLTRGGLIHSADSFGLCGDTSLLNGPRRYGQLVACRWPIRPLPPTDFAVPWPERVLSVVIDSPRGPVELHTTGIPPGCNNGWTKIEMFEGIIARLGRPHAGHRILCGDFNSPQTETPEGRVITWGDEGDRWDAGERGVLLGLAQFDLDDVFCRLHGCGIQEFSWFKRHKERVIHRRFDHVLASRSLRPVECRYVHQMREAGLSDHSPLTVLFAPTEAPPPGRASSAHARPLA